MSRTSQPPRYDMYELQQQLHSAIRLLYPDEITPTAKNVLTAIIDKEPLDEVH
jgi:hypothetical protein